MSSCASALAYCIIHCLRSIGVLYFLRSSLDSDGSYYRSLRLKGRKDKGGLLLFLLYFRGFCLYACFYYMDKRVNGYN